MGISSLIQRYPLLLPLISLGIGVFGGKKIFFSEWILTSYSVLLLCLIFLLLMFIAYCIQCYVIRWIYGMFLVLFFISLGGTLALISLEKTQCYFSSQASFYKVRLVSAVSNHPNSYAIDAELINRVDSVGFELKEKSLLRLYFEKDSLVSKLKCDDELSIYSKMQRPLGGLNYEAFDYGSYLLCNGYAGTGYVAKENWKKLNNSLDSKRSFKHWSLYCQEKVVKLYKKWNLEGESLSVLSALTIGYKNDLDEEVLNAFSAAGVSHILALSGLHVGFICMFFNFLLKRVYQKNQKLETVGKILLVSILWLFSFIVGSSPSVTRAVMMFSLFIFSSLGHRKRDSLQMLCVTALIMLLYHPLWLFSVGFQLSFVAVASILIIYPVIKYRFSFRSTIANYVWNTCSVSFVAQIGVLPLVIYYFSTIPLYFLLGNLLIIPLITVVIPVSFIALLTSFIPIVNSFLVFVLKQMLTLLLSIVKNIEQLPHSTINHLWIDETEVFILFVILILLTLFFYKPSVRTMTLFLSSLGLFLVISSLNLYKAQIKNALLFYNVSGCPVVHCVEKNSESYLAVINEKDKTRKLSQTMERFWNHYRLHPQKLANSEKHPNIFFSKPLLVFHNYKVAILDTTFCSKEAVPKPLKVDLVYICKGYKGNLSSVLIFFNPSEIILDASLPLYLQQSLQLDCNEKRIPCIALFKKGSYSITL